MPSISDENIVPGTGEVYVETISVTTETTTIMTTQGAVAANSDYVVPAQINGTTFIGLRDGPGGYVPDALLVSGTHSITYIPVPTSPNQVLVWSGSSYSWQILPSFSGVLSAATPFTETTGTITVATLANVTILSVKVIIKNAFDANSTINIGTTTSSNTILPAASIVQSQLGVYSEELYLPLTTQTVVQIAINATPGSTAGVGTLILEYITGTI